ncbi:MAG TPA: SLATT domain-containing protein [Bacteroidales bacterium]|nr:SLATT domain-containing protein [Bacteroidales bacterium]HPS17057.1 SLATT domain-containing protein [Bacteroidales bacterium]
MDGKIRNKYENYSWDANTAPAKINELYDQVIERIIFYTNWYKKYKGTKKWWSKKVRLFAIILFLISSLVPIIFPLIKSDNYGWILNIGYITAAIGGGLLFLDKFYGFSTGWMRINSTMLELGDARRDIERTMLKEKIEHKADTIEGFIALLDVIKKFDDTVSNIVKAETDVWLKEFFGGNEELQKLLKTQTEQLKPSDLKISVKNYNLYKNIQLTVDNTAKGEITGGSYVIKSIYPGNRTIYITALKTDGNKEVKKTDVATVKAGELNTIELSLE